MGRWVLPDTSKICVKGVGGPGCSWSGGKKLCRAHSFRRGAATMAAQCGIQDALIKTLVRWESSAYTRYIQTAPEVLCKVWCLAHCLRKWVQ